MKKKQEGFKINKMIFSFLNYILEFIVFVGAFFLVFSDVFKAVALLFSGNIQIASIMFLLFLVSVLISKYVRQKLSEHKSKTENKHILYYSVHVYLILMTFLYFWVQQIFNKQSIIFDSINGITNYILGGTAGFIFIFVFIFVILILLFCLMVVWHAHLDYFTTHMIFILVAAGLVCFLYYFLTIISSGVMLLFNFDQIMCWVFVGISFYVIVNGSVLGNIFDQK